MQVKSFTYKRSWYGIYHRQQFFSLEKMDTHVGKMLSRGWQVLTQIAHSGQGRAFVLLRSAIPLQSLSANLDFSCLGFLSSLPAKSWSRCDLHVARGHESVGDNVRQLSSVNSRSCLNRKAANFV